MSDVSHHLRAALATGDEAVIVRAFAELWRPASAGAGTQTHGAEAAVPRSIGGLAGAIAVAQGPWQPAVIALADAVRACAQIPPARQGPAIAQVAAIAGATLRWPATHITDAGAATAEAPELADHEALIDALYAHNGACGHLAALVNAVVEIADLCGAQAARGLIIRAHGALQDACDAPPGSTTVGHDERIALLDGRWQQLFEAADPSKAEAFNEPKFRRYLLDGTADSAFRAMAKAIAFGVPRPLLCASVGLAAAERLLRADTSADRAANKPAGWIAALQDMQLAAAAARLLRRRDTPHWLALLLFVTARISVNGAEDAPPTRRFVLPDPEPTPHTWDHGPEIAKICARLLAKDAPAAIAGLRGYMLLVLPVQPLCAQLVETSFEDLGLTAAGHAEAIATMTAGTELFAGLGEHPHRELVLSATLRGCCARLGDRTAHAFARAVLS